MRYKGKFKAKRLNSAEKRRGNILCPQCGSGTKIVSSGTVYKTKIPGKIRELLVCDNFPICDTYTSVNTKLHQYGIPANREVRTLRRQVHMLQEQVVSIGLMKKTDIYMAYRKMFCMPLSKCHVRCFDKGMCQKAINYHNSLIADEFALSA